VKCDDKVLIDITEREIIINEMFDICSNDEAESLGVLFDISSNSIWLFLMYFYKNDEWTYIKTFKHMYNEKSKTSFKEEGILMIKRINKYLKKYKIGFKFVLKQKHS